MDKNQKFQKGEIFKKIGGLVQVVLSNHRASIHDQQNCFLIMVIQLSKIVGVGGRNYFCSHVVSFAVLVGQKN